MQARYRCHVICRFLCCWCLGVCGSVGVHKLSLLRHGWIGALLTPPEDEEGDDTNEREDTKSYANTNSSFCAGG